MHWGDMIEERVDARGEVALLTRNIVIRGEMLSECPKENGNCRDYDYDTFGGHVKVLSCQPRVTVTSCFVYKVIRDLESIYHLCIYPIRDRINTQVIYRFALAQLVCTS